MKKMKFLLAFALLLVMVPVMASAKEDIFFKGYSIGDEITVTLSSDGTVKGKFVVIEASPEAEQKDVEGFVKGDNDYEYVTALYVGNIGKTKFANANDVTYKKSLVRSKLMIEANNAKWDTYEEERVLNLADLNRIGMTSNKVSASYLLANAPYYLAEDMQGDKAYSVSAAGDVALTLGSEELNVVPVIRVHKGWVDGGMICNCDDCKEERFCPKDPSISIQKCLDSGLSENVCIMKLCEKKVKPKDKVCPKDPSISIQDCLDKGGSEAACVEKLCTKKCPNDEKISIQKCMDEGSSEEACIKKLCPGSEKVKNEKTGVVAIGFGFILFLAAIYLASTKINYFRKVK